jgi:DNA primase
MIPKAEQANTPEHQPYMLGKAIEAVKEAVPIERLAAEYGVFKLAGTGRLLGRCIAPDHTDRTPSMTVYTDRQRFRCYGCGLSGDAIDLEEVAGRHTEAWTAVLSLSERYGVELPRRPEQWHKWQGEKHRRRRMVRDALTAAYQRRFFRVYGSYLADIGDPAEREAEARMLFDGLRTLAVAAAEHRMSR